MDENADMRLIIETARKNKNWARRCYAYELAMEYFSVLEPECYELCSYCDSIPEFLDEKNECCLLRALAAVKVFVNRCVEAPSIARAVTGAVVDKLFFSASTKVREIATDIILDFIEWEACNDVLKELIAGALKYDGVRSDECIRVMRYALLDFGPHVVNIYKLIDFIAVLVRNKPFFSINDECSQLLIVIYKCLGPQVRVHLNQILDPNYISAIEDSYEEMRNIPIYHCRFVRYSRDNSSSLRESENEMFAACRIAEPTSHPVPTSHENEELFNDCDGMVFEADQSRLREPFCRGGDAGPLANENKAFWMHQRFENVANYDMDYGIGGADQLLRNQVHLNAYDDVPYAELDRLNRADSLPELFRDVPLEPVHPGYQWDPNDFELFRDHIHPVSANDKTCQTNRFTLQPVNPFEVIIQKLMKKHGTVNILGWLWLKLNSNPIPQQNDEETKESREIHLSRNCKSLEALSTGKEQTHNNRSSASNTNPSVRLCFLHRFKSHCYLKYSNEHFFISKSDIKINENFIGKKTTIRRIQVSKKEIWKTKTATIIPTESINIKYFEPGTREKTKENISDLVKSKSEVCSTKRSSVRRFFRKIPLLFLNKKKTNIDASEDRKKNCKKFKFVFKQKENQQSYNIPTLFHPSSDTDHKTYYFRREASVDLQPSSSGRNAARREPRHP